MPLTLGWVMPLAVGKQLGPYEIEAAIRAGGMGEVYRARDTRLGRTVAIKVLPEGEFAGEEARRRLQREARVIAGVSHPHICTIHDIGDEQGLQFIVMEYLEGETLAARLERGPLPAAQVLQYGIEIADALEKAHRARIIHRDLKPGNIMLTKSGTKLLDFGLARITHRDSAPLMSALTALPTEDNSNITGIGAILGTLQYMAPEQLEARDTDARTDIFAFGAVLYEIITGQRAFRGKSQASLIAAILSSQPPPLLQLSPMSPALDRVVRTCLEKDPEERWQTAHDVRLQLEWIRDAGSQAGVPRLKSQRRITRERTAWAAVIVLFLALSATLAMRYVQPTPPASRKIMFTIEPPAGYKLSEEMDLALSPDGSRIAYTVRDAKGKKSLWMRSLDSLTPARLEGSDSSGDLSSLLWTPDGRALLAGNGDKLFRISAGGGAPELVCDKFPGIASSVNREGVALVWTPPPTEVFSVSLDDCIPHPRTPPSTSEVGYSYPHFLPDGKHFLFAAIYNDKRREVLLGSLDGAAPRIVVRNGSFPKYLASGYILFNRDGYLMAQPFDVASLRSSGDPFLVHRNQMVFLGAFGWAVLDASPNGTIVTREQSDPPFVLRWYGRSGQVLKTLTEPEYLAVPRISPQGNRALVSFWNPRTHVVDIWSLDLDSGARRRESFQDRSGNGFAVWSPTGEQIYYSVLLRNQEEIFVKKAGAPGNGELFQTGLWSMSPPAHLPPPCS